MLLVGSVFLHIRAAAVLGPTATDVVVRGFMAAPSHTQRTQRYAPSTLFFFLNEILVIEMQFNVLLFISLDAISVLLVPFHTQYI